MAKDTFNLFYPWFYQGEMSIEILNYKKEIPISAFRACINSLVDSSDILNFINKNDIFLI